MLFEGLINNKKMEDPEARVPEDLRRVEKPKKIKSKSSSVSMKTYRRTSQTIGIIVGLLIIGVIGGAIFYGIKLFIGA